jgi:hypothetical protein
MMTVNLAVMMTTLGCLFGDQALADENAGLKTKLMSDLTASFRRGHDEGRLLQFEEELSPMYASLPKNENSNLDHLIARYALHRFFIERHGWSIEGLAPVDAERQATPMSSLSQWMPDYLVNSIEQLLGTSGVTLREMAVLAATFEDLIHREASKRLEDVYDLLNLPKDAILHEKEAFEAIKLYMTMYTSGGNTTVRTKEDVMQKKGGLNLRTKKWLKEVQVKVAEEYEMCDVKTGDCGRLDFKAATRVVEEISEQYRSFNEHECEDLTQTLESEADSPGKVALADFYKEGLHGAWNFTESADYLQALGALENAGSNPHVLIPNYVSSRPNCLATSSIYVVCCRSKCESMLSELENAAKAPLADPNQIMDVLGQQFDSTSVAGLKHVAKQHGGKVPLHGQDFAQWLHEVFPQSCPRPHTSGISHIQPQSAKQSVEIPADFVMDDAVAAARDILIEEGFAMKEVVPVGSWTSLLPYSCLAALCIVGALWASQGVLVEANSFLYTHAKTEKLRMPVQRVILLSFCLIAAFYSLDKMFCEAMKSSTVELLLSAGMFGGIACVGWTAKKTLYSKPTELLPR